MELQQVVRNQWQITLTRMSNDILHFKLTSLMGQLPVVCHGGFKVAC